MTAAVVMGSITIAAGSAAAQKRYDLGASDTEIKIGNTMSYSGPLSPTEVIGKTELAYFTIAFAWLPLRSDIICLHLRRAA